MIGLGTLWSTGEDFGCTWEHLGVPERSLEVPTTCQGALGSTSNMSGSTSNCSRAVWENHILFGNVAGAPGNHSYYLSFNQLQISCIQIIFSYMYLCIYIATHLHTEYLVWPQVVHEGNSRCTLY